MSSAHTPSNPKRDVAPERMSGLQRNAGEREDLKGARVSKYTNFVQSMRIILPLSALITFMMLILWPQMDSPYQNTEFNSQEQETQIKQDVQSNKLLTARYEDIDSQGRPYVIEADEAVQRNDNPDIISLAYPRADLKLSDKMGLKIKSKSGEYAQNAQNLTLSGGVFFTRSDGTVLRTQRIEGNLKTGHAVTQDAVFIEGPSGTLDAQSMIIEDQGQRVIFKGPALLQVFQTNQIVPDKNVSPPLQEANAEEQND